MSAPKHTPEPWRTHCWSSHATSIVAAPDPAEPKKIGDQTVADYGLVHVADCNGSLRASGNDANAARIVACVNACAGIETDELTATTAAYARDGLSVLEAMKGSLILVTEERNALRAELRCIAAADPSQWEPDMRDQFRAWAQNRARDALNKVQS